MMLLYVNDVTLCQAQLVQRQVTVCGYNVLVCNQPLRPTQPPTTRKMGNKYQPRGSALWLGT